MFKISECKVIIKICPFCKEKKIISKFRKRLYKYSIKCKKCSNKRKGKFEKICLYCKKTFLGVRTTTKYCSKKCKDNHQKNMLIGSNNPNYKGKIKTNCSGCGKELYLIPAIYNKYKLHYCSIECRKNEKQCECKVCGNEFTVDNFRYKKNKNSFCSKECANKFHSESMKGVFNPRFRKDISLDERMVKRMYSEYYEFIKKVYSRDNYTCQITGKKGGNLEVHHLNGYNWDVEHRTDINNGITLRKEIHKLFHNRYGYKDNTKEQFEEFRKITFNYMPISSQARGTL